MTRGTIYCITDKEVLVAGQYNGDFYISNGGHGTMAMLILERTKSEEDFVNFMTKFNDATFQYENHEIYHEKLKTHFNGKIKAEKIIDLDKSKYFEVYHSDYIFFKNLSSKVVTIKTRGDKEEKLSPSLIFLQPGEQCSLSFGYNECYTTSSEQCIKEHKGSLDEEVAEEVFGTVS